MPVGGTSLLDVRTYITQAYDQNSCNKRNRAQGETKTGSQENLGISYQHSGNIDTITPAEPYKTRLWAGQHWSWHSYYELQLWAHQS